MISKLSTDGLKKLVTGLVINKYFQIFTLAFLAIVVVYTGAATSLEKLGNADAVVYPLLFQDFNMNDSVVPTAHSLFFKYPLYWLQGALPFNIKTYTAVNVIIYAITIFGWLYFSTRLFGKKYLSSIALLLSTLLLAAPALCNELIYSTCRNIEYIIGFAFIFMYAQFLRNPSTLSQLPVSKKILYTLVAVSMSLVIASDSYQAAIFMPAAIVIATYIFLKAKKTRSKVLQKAAITAILLALFSTLLGLVIRKLVEVFGLVEYAPNIAQTAITSWPQLIASISHLGHQLLFMSGADIFGKAISVTNSIYFLGLCIFILSTYCWYRFIRNSIKQPLNSLFVDRNIEILMLGLVGIFTVVIYFITGNVVGVTSEGYIPSGAQRYISIVPLILVLGVIIGLKFYTPKRNKELNISILCVTLPLIALVSLQSIYASMPIEKSTVTQRHIKIAQILNDNGVEMFAGDYWYGATVKMFAPLSDYTTLGLDCRTMTPLFNNKLSSVTPSQNTKISATIISNANYEKNCRKNLGKPSRSITVEDKLKIDFYNYDIRTKLTLPEY